LSEAAEYALSSETGEVAAPSPGPVLTEREAEVAALVARGKTNRQIAAELVIAVGTAQRHVANILTKLDVGSRTQVATWVVEHDRVGQVDT
jgi:non-specific serine/threonine protein kinase